jgi:lipid-A-disaccharide synthase
MVIVYRQSPITWAIMRRLLYLPYGGLPNILAGEKLVPEFHQDRATPAALSAALVELLRDTAAQKRQVERFHEMHHLLRQNTAEKAAQAVLEVMDGRRQEGIR